MADSGGIGIYLHSIFRLPGWGHVDMGLAGWKASIDWARALGYNRCVAAAMPGWRAEQADWTYVESRRMHHGLLAPSPECVPGLVVWGGDPRLDTPQAHRNAEILREALVYARRASLQPCLQLPISLGAPTFAEEHPELRAVHSGDFCQEPFALCPSRPDALEHLLELWGAVIDAHPEVDSFLLWPRDPGGCECPRCRGKGGLLHHVEQFCELVRSRRPDAELTLASWWLDSDEISGLAASLPPGAQVTACPLIHSLVRSEEEYLHQVRCWVDAGVRVHSWLEVQENPTIMLPSCYPRRIERAMRISRAAGVGDFVAASAFYTHTFALNFHVVAALARDPGLSAEQVTGQFLADSFGSAAVPAAMKYVEAMEEVWTRLYARSQHTAGFNWPWHMVFAGGLFPAKLLREQIDIQVGRDVDAAVVAAEAAVAAAEEMAGITWRTHSLMTNVLLISAKLLALRARFRQAKLPVLEAIRTGDEAAAIERFEPLMRLAREMTETAACAPNTQILNTHWCKLSLLPQRLSAVRAHLRELVQDESIRQVFDYGHRTEPVGL